jgi:hypothetical protein
VCVIRALDSFWTGEDLVNDQDLSRDPDAINRTSVPLIKIKK